MTHYRNRTELRGLQAIVYQINQQLLDPIPIAVIEFHRRIRLENQADMLFDLGLQKFHHLGNHCIDIAGLPVGVLLALNLGQQ